MPMKKRPGRRAFLKAAGAGTAGSLAAAGQAPAPASPTARLPRMPEAPGSPPPIQFPRVFRGPRLAMIAFPLGGVGAGSISLGGRGQLRDWEIFNKPDKGGGPGYAFPAIWAQAEGGRPVAKVLESRILPPFEGQNGLGVRNAPGLQRLDGAVFTGEFPLARIDFSDRKLPVGVALEAFTPFIPHEEDDSGIPGAVLRYRVRNPGPRPAVASIAWAIENPVGTVRAGAGPAPPLEQRACEFRSAAGLEGLMMTNPGAPASSPSAGSFALAAVPAGGRITHLRGWPRVSWWSAPMLYWDDFTADGRLGPESEQRNAVGALCLTREIPAGAEAGFTFLLAWHFPNRTPGWIGWSTAKGDEEVNLGNWYARRWEDAWAAASYLAANLERLEKKTRLFAQAFRESSLPPAVKDAASANLSTLCTTTCFRTADGEFKGWEGSNDKQGCCYGNCTHVWNYETATHYLFPRHARSLRRAAFGYAMDENGAIHFRQRLPDGKSRLGFAAADGQMGQIVKAYLDWALGADEAWLREMWPKVKRAIEFAWIKGGWDADRDGVMEGAQHNTYDVEFFGPNPQCGILYLGGLRAAEEMARAAGDAAAADGYRRLFERGRAWIDAHLFNGQYYIQRIQGLPKDRIGPALMSSMGSANTEQPELQAGEGCLIDQLMGEYLAQVAGLGPLLDPGNIRKALESIWTLNRRRDLMEHDSVQRIYALNDEPALIICAYGEGARPRIPFPYWAEAWTGLEYMAAAQLIFAGLAREGVECVAGARSRHDGERRNPWNEPECGHHYARAMSAWSPVVALSGFAFHGPTRNLSVAPRIGTARFNSFWATGTGWGSFTQTAGAGASRVAVKVLHGRLPLKSVRLAVGGTRGAAALGGQPLPCSYRDRIFGFPEEIELREGDELVLTS
jgi:uncharacterized protein (DUF608 family)